MQQNTNGILAVKMSNAAFICPSPLVYGIETSAKTVWILEPANCALRCPTITYTHDEWSKVVRQAEILFTIACVGTCVIFFYQAYTSKMKAEFWPRVMFLFGFFMISLIMVIFLFANGTSDRLTCEQESAFREYEGLCVFQAWSTVFFITWIEIWSFFMAYENYLFICSALEQSNRHGKSNLKYFAIAVIICFTCATIPLAVGNLGFDYQANIPICLYLVSDNRNYLWGTLVAPFGFFATLCLIYTLRSIHKIQSIFVASDKYDPNSRQNNQSRESEYPSDASLASQIRMVQPTTTPIHQYGDDRLEEQHKEPSTYEDYVEQRKVPSKSFLETFWNKTKRTWKYNGRQMIFFSTFCLCTLAIIPVVIYAYGTQFDRFVTGTEDFAECLIEAAAFYQYTYPDFATQESVDAFAESNCGKHPAVRPDTSLVMIMSLYFVFDSV